MSPIDLSSFLYIQYSMSTGQDILSCSVRYTLDQESHRDRNGFSSVQTAVTGAFDGDFFKSQIRGFTFLYKEFEFKMFICLHIQKQYKLANKKQAVNLNLLPFLKLCTEVILSNTFNLQKRFYFIPNHLLLNLTNLTLPKYFCSLHLTKQWQKNAKKGKITSAKRIIEHYKNVPNKVQTTALESYT